MTENWPTHRRIEALPLYLILTELNVAARLSNAFCSSKLEVNLFFSRRISHQVEKNQTLITQMTLTEEWHDPRLTWKSHHHDGIQRLMFPAHMIWLPDTYIFNKCAAIVSPYNSPS